MESEAIEREHWLGKCGDILAAIMQTMGKQGIVSVCGYMRVCEGFLQLKARQS